MKHTALLSLLTSVLLSPPAVSAGEGNPWTFDVSLYGLAVGMSGDVAVKGIPAEVDFGFDDVWDNLDFAMMGKVRVGYDRWALNADVVYIAGFTWITKPAAAPANSITTCSTKGRNSASQSIFEPGPVAQQNHPKQKQPRTRL